MSAHQAARSVFVSDTLSGNFDAITQGSISISSKVMAVISGANIYLVSSWMHFCLRFMTAILKSTYFPKSGCSTDYLFTYG